MQQIPSETVMLIMNQTHKGDTNWVFLSRLCSVEIKVICTTTVSIVCNNILILWSHSNVQNYYFFLNRCQLFLLLHHWISSCEILWLKEETSVNKQIFHCPEYFQSTENKQRIILDIKESVICSLFNFFKTFLTFAVSPLTSVCP